MSPYSTILTIAMHCNHCIIVTNVIIAFVMFQNIVTIAIQCIAAIVASTCIWPECGEFVLLTSFEVLCFGIQRILLSNLKKSLELRQTSPT